MPIAPSALQSSSLKMFGWILLGATALFTGSVLAVVTENPRWSVGLVILPSYLVVVSAVHRKRRFLLASFVLAFNVQTNVNLWRPAEPPFFLGNASTTTALELFAFDPPLLLLVAYLVLSGSRGRLLSGGKRGSDIAAAAFGCFVCLSVIPSAHPLLTLVRIPVLLRMPLIYFAVTRAVRSQDDLRLVTRLLFGSLLFQSALSIVQTAGVSVPYVNYLTEHAEQVDYVDLGAVEGARATGTIGYTTILSQYLGMLWPLALARILFGRSARERSLSVAALSLAVVSLVLSLSRAEWINFVVVPGVLAVSAVIRHGGGRRVVMRLAAAALCLVAVVAMLAPMVMRRLTIPDSDSAWSRIPMARVALEVIADHPALGVGLAQYTAVMNDPPYDLQALFPGGKFGVHNAFLYLAAELGIPALLTLLFLFLTGWAYALGGMRSAVPILREAATWLVGGLTACFVHSNVEQSFHTSLVLNCLLWTMLALAIVVHGLGELGDGHGGDAGATLSAASRTRYKAGS